MSDGLQVPVAPIPERADQLIHHDPNHFLELGPPFGGHVHVHRATVLRAPGPGDEAFRLQLVQEAGDVARRYPHRVGELPRGRPAPHDQRPQEDLPAQRDASARIVRSDPAHERAKGEPQRVPRLLDQLAPGTLLRHGSPKEGPHKKLTDGTVLSNLELSHYMGPRTMGTAGGKGAVQPGRVPKRPRGAPTSRPAGDTEVPLLGPALRLPIPRRYEFPFLDRRQETPTAITVRFSTEGTEFQYLSNQAIRLVLPEVSDPYGPARTFSLSSSPSEPGLIAVTTKMTGSPYKEALSRLRPGDRVTVLGPVGDLLFNPRRPAVFVAGGIGVTPFRGMLRFAVDTGATQPIRMLYSARVPEEFAFREELDALAKAHGQARIHYTVTRPTDSRRPWRGRTGRIDIPWIREVSQALDRPKFYVAGLPEMANETVQRLRVELGIPEDDLEYEYFGGY